MCASDYGDALMAAMGPDSQTRKKPLRETSHLYREREIAGIYINRKNETVVGTWNSDHSGYLTFTL